MTEERREPLDGIDDRYAELRLERGDVVIYDRERTHAWIRSDRSVSLADGRHR